MSEIRKIAVLTSGGDSPGMNACIRAVVRTASYHKVSVLGVLRGYEGLIKGDFQLLDNRSVGNIIHRGGTVLKTARSEAFRTPEGRRSAFEQFQAEELDALVVIGGNGTFTGARLFSEEFGVPVMGCPGTIDNDLFGTDLTIGFDTAVNTAIESIDRIRDTADSHDRLFFVEVMGRNSGCIALHAAIGGGAGTLLVPEVDTGIDQLVEILNRGAKRKKLFNVVIVAEGNPNGNAYQIAEQVRARFTHSEIKVAVIGHLQRGGAPTALDRILASRLGFEAVEALLAGRSGEMVGLRNNEVVFVPFEVAIGQSKPLNPNLLRLSEVLAI
jgi:6-phosphofructokinase 1